MKITATQYAKTLFELTAEKSSKEIDVIVANFIKLLNQKRQLKLAGKVIAKFNEIWNEKNGIVEAEVTSARKLESSQVHKVESFIKEKYSAEKIIINNKIDLNIKGGIVIKVGDEVLDGSLSCQLQRLRSSLEK